MMRQNGFTLLEVLVAIAIFAVLTAAGWQVFDQLLKNRERNGQHAQHLMQLQTAYSQILRDLNQVVPIAGQQNNDLYPALSLQNNNLQFNRAGVIDPLQQGLDQFEFIEYRYDAQQQALLRYKSAYMYRQNVQNMQADVVLSTVEELQIRVLDPALQDTWPAQTVETVEAEQALLSQLPKGIEFKFKYHQQDYRWVFSLVSALPSTSSLANTPLAGEDNEPPQ